MVVLDVIYSGNVMVPDLVADKYNQPDNLYSDCLFVYKLADVT